MEVRDEMDQPSSSSSNFDQNNTPTSINQNLIKTSSNPSSMFIPILDQGRIRSTPISGSDDLLSIFNLMPVYDRFVKPYLKPITDQSSSPNPSNQQQQQHSSSINNNPGSNNGSSNDLNGCLGGNGSGLINGDLKGKSKAEIGSSSNLGNLSTDHLGQKRMKMEKSYGHFVGDVGGRNSIKKDHQLQSWIMDPNFQEPHFEGPLAQGSSSGSKFLRPFDEDALAQAFSFQVGTLPGFDSSVWIAEEGGPKRKRKKRKQGEMMAGTNEPIGTTTSTTNTTMATTTMTGMNNQMMNSNNNRSNGSNLNNSNQNQSNFNRASNNPDSNGIMKFGNNNNQIQPNGQQQQAQPQQQQQQQQQAVGAGGNGSNGKDENDHRKKKRTKLNSNNSNNHQIALQL